MGYDDFYSVAETKSHLIEAIIKGYASLIDYEQILSEQDIKYIKTQITKEKKS